MTQIPDLPDGEAFPPIRGTHPERKPDAGVEPDVPDAMPQTLIQELEGLLGHVRALVTSVHITGEERDELRGIRDRLETRVRALRKGEDRRPQLEPLSNEVLFADVTAMSHEALMTAQTEITAHLKHGHLTTDGRNDLRQRLRAIEDELDRIADSAQIEHHASLPTDNPERYRQ